MSEPTPFSTRPRDPSYWLIPGMFLRDTLVNVAMFACLAVAAFVVDWLVQYLAIGGLSPFVKILLEGTAYVLAGCDSITFICIQVFLVYTTIKTRFRL